MTRELGDLLMTQGRPRDPTVQKKADQCHSKFHQWMAMAALRRLGNVVMNRGKPMQRRPAVWRAEGTYYANSENNLVNSKGSQRKQWDVDMGKPRTTKGVSQV